MAPPHRRFNPPSLVPVHLPTLHSPNSLGCGGRGATFTCILVKSLARLSRHFLPETVHLCRDPKAMASHFSESNYDVYLIFLPLHYPVKAFLNDFKTHRREGSFLHFSVTIKLWVEYFSPISKRKNKPHHRPLWCSTGDGELLQSLSIERNSLLSLGKSITYA